MSDGISAMYGEYDYYTRLCNEYNEEPYKIDMTNSWLDHLDELINNIGNEADQSGN